MLARSRRCRAGRGETDRIPSLSRSHAAATERYQYRGSLQPSCAVVVYYWCMARTNVDIDDEACAAVMRQYCLATKREAINFALRSLASEPFSLDEARQMRGAGWDGDLDKMRGRIDDPR